MSTRRFPAESEPIAAVWTAWPHHEDWADALNDARGEVAAFCRTVSEPAAKPEEPPGAPVRLMTLNGETPALRARAFATAEADEAGAREEEDASTSLEGVTASRARYGDIWLRDTGPVFVLDADGPRAIAFRFNGWGEKYQYPGDELCAEQIARAEDMPLERVDLVCEGGALETDGAGTLITTRACLLDRKRNPSFSEGDVTRTLCGVLGAETVIWLDDGLLNDHTDGHVDTLARFVEPGVVVCQAPAGPDDPNAARLDEIARTLDKARDAAGRRLDVVRVPSPGLVQGADKDILPASHMNYMRVNGRMVVPVYAPESAGGVISALSDIFTDCVVTPSPARALVSGGGAFHCITNHIPPREAWA